MKARNLFTAIVATAIIVCGAGAACAANSTWTGTTSSDWNIAGNWSAGIPGAGFTAFFDATGNGRLSVTTTSLDQPILNITFNAGAGAYVISTTSHELQLGSGGAIQTASGITSIETISVPLQIGSGSGAASYTFTSGSSTAADILQFTNAKFISDFNGTSGAVTLTFNGSNTGANLVSGVIKSSAAGGAVSVIKDGTGTWTLSGVNTYSGGTTVSAGTLQINQTTGAAATGTFNLGGGTLAINAPANNFAYASTINLTADSTLNFLGSSQINHTGTLTGNTHALNFSTGTGRVYMNGTVSGVTQFNVTSGAMGFDLSTGNRGGGAPVVVFSGASLFLFNANNTLANNITLNGGTGLGGIGALDVETGGSLNPTLSGTLTLNSGTSKLNMGGHNLTLSGNLTGSGSLQLTNSGGASTFSLSGSNSGFTGTFTVDNGNAMSFNSANAGSSGAAWVFNDSNADRVRINVGNNTLNFGSLSGSGQMQNDTSATTSTISVGALNTDTTFSGTIKNNGTGILALTKVGSGTLTLSGANTYTGATVIKSGTLLDLRSGGATALGSSSGLTIGDTTGSSAATFSISQVSKTISAPITIAAGSSGLKSIITSGGGQTFTLSGGITLNDNLTFSSDSAHPGTDAITVSSGISGTGNVTIATLSGSTGANLFSASVNMTGAFVNNSAGSAAVTVSGAIGASVTGVTQNSATSSLTLTSGSGSITGAPTPPDRFF